MTSKEKLLFGERIRCRRDTLRLSQEYVAEKTGISLRFYQALERGEKGVSLDTLMRLSKVLNISIDYLLLGDLANTVNNPLADIFNKLSQRQRDDALTILQIYVKSCKR